MEGKQNAKAKSQCSQELGLLMCETLRWRNLNKASLWSWWVKKKGKALHHPCAWIESCWPSRRGSLSWGTFWWIQPRPLRFWLTIKICNILGTWSVCPLSCLFGHFFFSHLFALYYRLDKQNGRANILLHQAALAGPDEADLLPCNFFLSMEFCCGYTHECFFSVCWWTSDCSFGQGNDSQNLQGKDSCLHSDEQLYIPISTLCIQVLQCIHDALIAGHGSHQKPAWSHEEILVAHSSCWCCELCSLLAISSPGSRDLTRVKKGCRDCYGPYQILRLWQIISIFVVDLLMSKGHTSMFVVLDSFMRAVIFLPLRRLATSPQTVPLSLQYVFHCHSLLDHMVMDRVAQFIAQFWDWLWACSGHNSLFPPSITCSSMSRWSGWTRYWSGISAVLLIITSVTGSLCYYWQN